MGVSLLGKWLSSENASSPETKKNAKIIRESLGLTPRQYRKMLTYLRNEIKIVETLLSKRKYKLIQYDKLPSKASLIYRRAFLRNDEQRYKEYLENVKKGVVKVNAKTLYPYDIVHKILDARVYMYDIKEMSREDIILLDEQWKALPDFIGERKENSIAVVDTSGSMWGTPLEVAISLGIYLAERNKGVFHNHFFTFSETPELQEVIGDNIVEKVVNLSRANWGYSTNIEAVFRKILEVAIENNVPADEMVGKVYVISDMQFNECTEGAELHIFKNLEEKYNEAGYKMPDLVFWNVNAFKTNVPFTMNELGVQLVSGFSPSIFKQLMESNGLTPYELMLKTVNSERYAKVTA